MIKFKISLLVSFLLFLSVLTNASQWIFVGEPVAPIRISEDFSNYRITDPNDPNLDPDWDWTTDQPYELFIKGATTPTIVSLPYKINEGPASILNKKANTDIKPEEGWVLLYRDFGTEKRKIKFPKFILYNRFRGTLRVIYYNTSESNFSYAIATIEQLYNGKRAALFSFGRKDYFLEGFDQSLILSAAHQTQSRAWSYVDFTILGFQKNLATDASLRFKIYGVEESDVQLEGDLTLSQILNSGQVNGRYDTKKAIDKGARFFKEIQSAKDSLRDDVNKNPDSWYAKHVLSLLGSSFANFIPGIAGVAGFITSFISSGEENRPLPMKFAGEIELTGKITKDSLIDSFTLKTPGAGQSDPSEISGLPLYDKPIGVFNLERKPSFYQGKEYCVDIDGTHACYGAEFGNIKDLAIVINPDILRDATVTTEIGIGSDFVNYSTIESLKNGHAQLIYYPFEITTKLSITPHASSDKPITIINRHQAQVSSDNESITVQASYDSDGEELFLSWNDVGHADYYTLHADDKCYRVLTDTSYSRELKPQYIDWPFFIVGREGSSSQGCRGRNVGATPLLTYCSLNPNDSRC